MPDSCLCVGFVAAEIDLSADIMLCYKNGRTAHLMTSADCNLPNSAVIWGTKGILEVYAFVCFCNRNVAEFL